MVVASSDQREISEDLNLLHIRLDGAKICSPYRVIRPQPVMISDFGGPLQSCSKCFGVCQQVLHHLLLWGNVAACT